MTAPMITELEIDAVIVDLEHASGSLDERMQQWLNWQPHLMAFLFSDSFSALLPVEQETFLFGATVLLTLSEKNNTATEIRTEEEIGAAEEANWAIFESVKASSFEKKMDMLFEYTTQEDALAFVEDLCADPEEEEITKPGAEIMIVGLKTLIDLLFAPKM